MAVAIVGLVVGFLLSVPPTGPVALLVLRSLLREEVDRALRIALGTTVADVPYALLGALGYGYVIARDPVLSAAFDAAGAVLLLAISVHLLRTPLGEHVGGEEAPATWGDFATGFLLGILNPTQILSWSVAASVGPVVPGDEPGSIVAWTGGTVVGQALWWVLLTGLWRRHPALADRAKPWLARGGGLIGIVVALDLGVRAVSTVSPTAS